MAYFDDPAHKAQWEKELAALREEKQRRINSGAAGGRKPQPQKTVKLPTFEELVQQAALRRQNGELRRQQESPRMEAPRNEKTELPAPEKSPRREPEKRPETARGTERVRMTFAQLVAEEESHRQQTISDHSRQKQRTMEAGNAL